MRDSSTFLAYSKNKDIKLRNKLAEANHGLVRQVAHRFITQCREPFEDLCQIGALGLIRAIERFDPTKGNAFSSFAIPFIRGEIQHYLRDRGRTVSVPRAWQECYQSVKRKQRLAAEKAPSEVEVAASLGVGSTQWQQVSQAVNSWVLPLKPEICEVPVEEPEEESPECDRLRKALKQLPTKHWQCIEKVYFSQLTAKQAARELDLSLPSMERLLQEAISNLGYLLGESKPKSTATNASRAGKVVAINKLAQVLGEIRLQ